MFITCIANDLCTYMCDCCRYAMTYSFVLALCLLGSWLMLGNICCCLMEKISDAKTQNNSFLAQVVATVSFHQASVGLHSASFSLIEHRLVFFELPLVFVDPLLIII